MKLLTPEIIDALPKIYSTNSTPLQDKMVICQFISPLNGWQWYVFEGESFTHDDEAGNIIDDIKCFGMVHGFEKEMGYFLLSEISPYIIRNPYIFKARYGDLIKCKA